MKNCHRTAFSGEASNDLRGGTFKVKKPVFFDPHKWKELHKGPCTKSGITRFRPGNNGVSFSWKAFLLHSPTRQRQSQ